MLILKYYRWQPKRNSSLIEKKSSSPRIPLITSTYLPSKTISLFKLPTILKIPSSLIFKESMLLLQTLYVGLWLLKCQQWHSTKFSYIRILLFCQISYLCIDWDYCLSMLIAKISNKKIMMKNSMSPIV